VSAWTQTATGRAFYFAAPVIEPAHLFSEVAHGLAMINRFSGQTATPIWPEKRLIIARPISVAQHSVLMAEEAFADTGDSELAAFCLLHDGHEAYIGDWTSPGTRAVFDQMLGVGLGVPAVIGEAQASRFKSALSAVKRRIDVNIFNAAGLDLQRYLALAETVHAYDMQALITERRDLMAEPSQPWDEDRNPDALPR
jgi:hypothetical protein